VTAGTGPAGGTASIVGILLAAGAGTRFGGRKLLSYLPDGTALGVAALRNLRSALARVLVVVRTGDNEALDALGAEGVPVIECTESALGMGHSLAAGVRASADAGGWIIALGDMPRVRPETIQAIARDLAAGARIVVPVYQGQRGHPVGFAASTRADLLALAGDVGARPLLERYADEVRRLPVDDPGILQDVDTQEDLARVSETGMGA